MFFLSLKLIYTDNVVECSAAFLRTLLFFIISFCLVTCPDTYSKLIKKYTAASTFLKAIKKRSTNTLSIAHQHQHQNKRPQPYLSVGSADGSSLWSNAVNFKKTIDAQADPRTGMLSAHIKVGGLLSNEGHGPDIDLQANYNSGTTADPDGLGFGWSWNLTYFNPVTNRLTTSTGQNFFLKKTQNGWFPLYHKLQDIRIDNDKQKAFVITYANGLRETLNHDGYEIKLQQQNGWSVHFFYTPGTHLLQSIKDDIGHTIVLHYKSGKIHVINRDALGKPVTLIIDNSQGEIRNLSFRSPDNQIVSGIYIRYMGHFITQINYPTGLVKDFSYDCKSAMKLSLPGYSSAHALCVITKVAVDPGAHQPVMTVHYSYSQANYNQHNYLGFHSGLSVIPSSAKDILFEAPVDYTYQTEENNGIIKEIRTYNKYHLLIDDKRINAKTGKKLSEVQTFFCRTNNPNGCAHSSFENLPDFYSLPLKIITRLWSDGAVYPAISSETIIYDKHGRVSQYRDSFGRLTTTKYCPEQGDTACPPVSPGWLNGALTESVTRYPAPINAETVMPAPITTYNYYRKMPAYKGDGYTMVLDHQVTQAKKQYTAIQYNYYQDPDNAFLYGLLKQMIFTGSIQKPSAITAISKHYYYLKSADNQTKTTYTAIDLKSGKRQLSPKITTSLFTNQKLQDTDRTGLNMIRYHYDFMGRLIQANYTSGTSFANSDHYEYIVSSTLNQLLITSVNNLQEKFIFDGAGRILINFKEAISATGKPVPDHWFPVGRVTYDHYGRVLAKHAYIIKESGEIHALTTTQDYDSSGRVVRIHLPDQREIITGYDDADRCVVNYEKSSAGEYSAVSVSHANVLYQPVMNLLIPATKESPPTAYRLCHLSTDAIKTEGAKVSSVIYDTFGRVVKRTDPFNHTVKTIYDELDEVTDMIDSKGDRMHSVYDLTGHVIQSWAYPVSGGHYLLSSAEYNSVGELLWSAGEDARRSTFTYNENGQLLSSVSPAGHTISLQYNVLGLPVAQLLDGKLQSQRYYDPITTLLIKKKEITGTTTFVYDADGLIRNLIHSGKNGYSDYKQKWEYDLNRRLTRFTDMSGNQKQINYDSSGRVKTMLYLPLNGKAATIATSDYDDFSRIKTLHYGSGMDRHLRYDTFGHPAEITDTLNNHLLYDESFKYDAIDNITTLIEKTSKDEYAKLNYSYDVLNNLVGMTCTGSNELSLCPRDTHFLDSGLTRAPVITQQDYTFTPLNRLASVREILRDSSTKKTLYKEMNYHYSDLRVPLRLQQIDTIWNHQAKITHNFNYDVMGNMVIDGEGNHLTYNAFNQIEQVTKTTGQKSFYYYDNSGKTVKTVSAEDTRYLFYQGSRLSSEKISSTGQSTHLIGYLGAAKTIDGAIHTYNETDYKGDIVGVLNRVKDNISQYTLNQRNVYSPYGMVFHCKKYSQSLPLYQKTLYGFDGKLTDPATSWQFLGNGHRTYNPKMRYFVSEDPAGGGYSFGSNNPVMNSDPSGNMPKWLGSALKWFGNITSFGLNALHQKWANIASTVIMAGLTVVSLGTTAASYGGAALGAVAAGGAAIYSSVPVIAAAVPSNKGLNIAASVIGLTEMAVTLATATIEMGFFLSEPLPLPVSFDNADPEMVNFKMLAVASCKVDGSAIELNTHRPLQLLRKHAGEYIKKVNGEDALVLDDYNAVRKVWRVLKSEENEVIVCDTGVLLVAAQRNKKPLFLDDYQSFIKAKFAFLISAAFKTEDLQQKTNSFMSTFAAVLNKLSANEKYVNTFDKPLDSFENVLTKPFQAAVTQHKNHVNIFARDDRQWYWYYFQRSGGTGILAGTLAEIKESRDINAAIFKDCRVYGYMRLQ